MSKPVIGIVGSNALYDSARYKVVEKFYINSSYINAVINNGAIPMPIPVVENDDELFKLLDLCDGLLLPGGEDIDPAYYNENPHPRIGVIRPDMDKLALRCFDYFYKKNMPVFGICKGMQLINVALGGTLYQDIESQYGNESILHLQAYSREYAVHTADIEENTLLKEILSEKTVKVNKMHHQAVKKVGDGLIASAYAPDGIIEAIESEDKTIFAVQWHPEELVRSVPEMNKLFRRLVDMASGK